MKQVCAFHPPCQNDRIIYLYVRGTWYEASAGYGMRFRNLREIVFHELNPERGKKLEYRYWGADPRECLEYPRKAAEKFFRFCKKVRLLKPVGDRIPYDS